MTWLLLASLASATEFYVDARVPAEIFVGGQPIAQLFYPGILELFVVGGDTRVVVVTNGTPQSFDVHFGDEPVVLLVGKSGISFGNALARETEEVGPPVLELRSSSTGTLIIQIGDQRIPLGPGEIRHVELETGEHRFSVRSEDGTAIYSAGTLALSGGPMVAQIAEGKMPEFVGTGGKYRPKN